MADYSQDPFLSDEPVNPPVKEKTKILLPVSLFIVTFITTTLAGYEWMKGIAGPIELYQLSAALPYSLSILFFLACHEFGHYFAARYHKVVTTLPYFIPFISLEGLFLNFGTLGAVIRTKSRIENTKALFDIGVAGPLAGFVAALGILIYGFTHLPPIEYLLAIHPDYFEPGYGAQSLSLSFGDTILFSILRTVFAPEGAFVPPMSEIYHYPYLCVGWFGLFVTSMNLIPVGQLDGGHICYGLFGEEQHYKIASISIIVLIVFGVLGILQSFVFGWIPFGWSGWLFWAVILYFIVKVKHPPVAEEIELDGKRKITGYIALLIFILCFSPSPFVISGNIGF